MYLGNFIKDASVSNLDWLDIDEEGYRETETLPKQNLDIQPDLEALWNREGESPTAYLVPNVVTVPTPGIKDPKTMGDMSQAHGKLRNQAEEIRKVARLILIQSSDVNRIKDELVKRFGMEPLKEHREVLASVFQERGLLGKLYINASDFPNCVQGGKSAEFVRKYANAARYVLAKDECKGCSCANTVAGNHCHCGVFHKEIKVDLPYTDSLANDVEKCCGKCSKEAASPKERIRKAFLASAVSPSVGVYSGFGSSPIKSTQVSVQGITHQLSQTEKDRQEKQASLQAQPIVKFLHKEMVKGLSRADLVKSLKLAFDSNLLVQTHKYWKPIFDEAGVYGILYTKQASFDDCHTGADFLAKHNPNVKAVVAGEKCDSCIYNKTRCLLYGKPLIKSASEIATDAGTLSEHKANKLQPWWETAQKALPQTASIRMGFMEGFHGQIVHKTSEVKSRAAIIKQAASRYMNEGLYGQDLLQALKTRFEIRDIVAAKGELRTVLAEQGLQGIFYVDPSVYDDYGKGCDEASRLHRTRLVGYLKQGSKCASCIHQVQLGVCSKIGKKLVTEPPYVDKVAQQREVLASGRATKISFESLVNNGTSMITEFQMQNEMNVEVQDAPVSNVVAVQLGTGKVKI